MKMLGRLKQSWRINLLFALLGALLIAGALLMNGIVLLLSDRYALSIDLTENAAYELGEDTVTLLAGLQQPVEIFVLSAEDAFPFERISWRRVLIKAGLKGREKKRAKAMMATLSGSLGKPKFEAISLKSSFAGMVFSIGDSIVFSGSRS